MKALLALEDTPKGVHCRVYWQGNDCTDKPDESVSMMVMTNLTQVIRHMVQCGAVKLEMETTYDQ